MAPQVRVKLELHKLNRHLSFFAFLLCQKRSTRTLQFLPLLRPLLERAQRHLDIYGATRVNSKAPLRWQEGTSQSWKRVLMIWTLTRNKTSLLTRQKFSVSAFVSQYWRNLLMSSKDLLRSINDPEHPLTLEQLKVVSAEQITVTPDHVMIRFTPTIPHCSMATLIGKCSLAYCLVFENLLQISQVCPCESVCCEVYQRGTRLISWSRRELIRARMQVNVLFCVFKQSDTERMD